MTLDEFREVKRTAEHNNKSYFVNLGYQDNEYRALFHKHDFLFYKQAMAYLKYLIKEDKKNETDKQSSDKRN